MTTNLDARFASYHSPVLSIFRIIVGLLYAIHGAQKLFAWPVGTPDAAGNLTGPAVPLGTWPLWWAGIIEFVCGILIALGLFTRIAAFIASGEMAVAYFWMHWPPLDGPAKPFWPIANGGEPAVVYCFAFLLLATAGAGAWSVDARRRARVGAVAPGRVVTGTAAPTATAPRRGLLSRFRRRY
jgi:putative oxidoreductase